MFADVHLKWQKDEVAAIDFLFRQGRISNFSCGTL